MRKKYILLLILLIFPFVYGSISSSSSLNWASKGWVNGNFCQLGSCGSNTTINNITNVYNNVSFVNVCYLNESPMFNGTVKAYGFFINNTPIDNTTFYPRFTNPAKYQNDTQVNATIDTKLLGNIWFFVINYTERGTAEGDINLTQNYNDYDGKSMNITGTVAGSVIHYMNTSNNVSTSANKICIRYKADKDTFNLDLFDDSGIWETYLLLAPTDTFVWVCSDIRDSTDHLVNNKIMVRISGQGIGLPATSRKIYIDAIYVGSGYVSSGTTEVDPIWNMNKYNYYNQSEVNATINTILDNPTIARASNLSALILNSSNITCSFSSNKYTCSYNGTAGSSVNIDNATIVREYNKTWANITLDNPTIVRANNISIFLRNRTDINVLTINSTYLRSPVINTTTENLTITSAGGAIIFRMT